MNQQLLDIIKCASKIALDEQMKMSISIKSDHSIVTNGDLAVSKYLETELKKLYPDHDIFSEENTGNIPNSKKVIIIDPIDGTESYSRKEDTWSILIGFLDDLKPVGGVVYQPSNDTLFYGFKGQGAFKQTSEGTIQLEACGYGELKGIQSLKNYGELDFFKKQGIVEIDQMFSAALKIMKVAEGATDLYLNFRKKCSLWDLVAPVAILTEAGGSILYHDPITPSFIHPHIDTKFYVYGQRITSLNL
jgi:3'(2'), 5'-bisphosphate nucleotidase